MFPPAAELAASVSAANHSLKEDIRAYWSRRAESFDDSAGHRIEEDWEMPEWIRLFAQALGGPGSNQLKDSDTLDLACGTGEISRILLTLGARVTAVDFSEPMLRTATHKHAKAIEQHRWTGILADAEYLHWFDPESFDFIVMRNLVWTLTDPQQAYREWFRVLRPGGRVLIIDGDHATTTWWQGLMRWMARRLPGNTKSLTTADKAAHNAIMMQLPYAAGLTAGKLATELSASGFGGFEEHSLARVYGRGMRGVSLADRLRLNSMSRFALVATKPLCNSGG